MVEIERHSKVVKVMDSIPLVKEFAHISEVVVVTDFVW